MHLLHKILIYEMYAVSHDLHEIINLFLMPVSSMGTFKIFVKFIFFNF
jgi:hypothetical protein